MDRRNLLKGFGALMLAPAALFSGPAIAGYISDLKVTHGEALFMNPRQSGQRWTHFAVVRKGGVFKAYVNGAEVHRPQQRRRSILWQLTKQIERVDENTDLTAAIWDDGSEPNYESDIGVSRVLQTLPS